MNMLNIWLREDFSRLWGKSDPFDQISSLTGSTVRQVANRRTFRFEISGRGFFAKVHKGAGWPEIFKNLMVGKPPVLDASNEFLAAKKLADLGIGTLSVGAYGVKGKNPARRESFLVTDEITGVVSLEELVAKWRENPPIFRDRVMMLRKLGELSRKLHLGGVVHRDFYLCHILFREGDWSEMDSLMLIDLHRALIRTHIPYRYLIKDLGALYFSSMDCGFSFRDCLRFLAHYFQLTPREVLETKTQWIIDLHRRAGRLKAREIARTGKSELLSR